MGTFREIGQIIFFFCLKAARKWATLRQSLFPMKCFKIVVLSLFLLNAGVAWALDSCLHLRGHVHHNDGSHADSHDAGALPVSDSAGHLGSDPRCAYVHFELDPGIGTTQVASFAGSSALNRPASTAPVMQSENRDLWLAAVFRQFPAFLALRGLSHHLFFSVLRI
ncbi:MAG TPA: hypothetical protein VNN13_05010 [Methylomirabilota bacterium]|nr:hypothetical protein [Methylomirabilota bacterium]